MEEKLERLEDLKTNGLLDKIDISLSTERYYSSMNYIVLKIKVEHQGHVEYFNYNMPPDEFKSHFDRIFEQAGIALKRKILEGVNNTTGIV